MKYKKYFKLKYNDNSFKYDKVYNGDWGLKCSVRLNLTNEQLTSAIKSLKRIVRKKNFLIIRVNPFWFITQKPRDVRMGRGKGNPAFKVYPLRPGNIIFEIKNVNYNLCTRAFHYCSKRLPGKFKIVKKDDIRSNNFKGSW